MSDLYARPDDSPRQRRQRGRGAPARAAVFWEVVCATSRCPRLGKRIARWGLSTDSRFGSFEDAWDSEGIWAEGVEFDRTTTMVAPDGHRTHIATCPDCGKPIQVTEARVEAALREVWARGGRVVIR